MTYTDNENVLLIYIPYTGVQKHFRHTRTCVNQLVCRRAFPIDREFVHALLDDFCLSYANVKMMCELHINTSLQCAVNVSFSTTATRINQSIHEFQTLTTYTFNPEICNNSDQLCRTEWHYLCTFKLHNNVSWRNRIHPVVSSNNIQKNMSVKHNRVLI